MASSTCKYPLLSISLTVLLTLLVILLESDIHSSKITSVFTSPLSLLPNHRSPPSSSSLSSPDQIVLNSTSDKEQQVFDFSNPSITQLQSHNRANAALYVLCRNSDLYSLLETIQIYEDRFNRKFNYDWVFLNDKPFDENFIRLVNNSVSGVAKFGQIPKEHWEIPESVNVELMQQRMDQMVNDPEGAVPYADSLSYRHMCRYESGYFYQHKLLSAYDYYWRVEPGVKLYCDINEDPFKTMELGKYKYGFSISTLEYPKTIPSLFKIFKNYLLQTNQSYLLLNHTNYSEFIYDETKDDYNLCHFWSNFELGDLNFLRSKEYNDIFNHLDSTNGFYYERWGDAPVRSLILSVLLKKGEIKRFDEIGYKHPPYLQCPMSEEVRLNNRCSCNPEEDFTNRWFSCSWFFDKVDKPKIYRL